MCSPCIPTSAALPEFSGDVLNLIFTQLTSLDNGLESLKSLRLTSHKLCLFVQSFWVDQFKNPLGTPTIAIKDDIIFFDFLGEFPPEQIKTYCIAQNDLNPAMYRLFKLARKIPNIVQISLCRLRDVHDSFLPLSNFEFLESVDFKGDNSDNTQTFPLDFRFLELSRSLKEIKLGVECNMTSLNTSRPLAVTLSKGNRFEGVFVNGAIKDNTKGIITCSDGRYEVLIKDRNIHSGTFTSNHGVKYEGEFSGYYPKEKMVTLIYQDLGRYVGHIKEWNPHGPGIATCQNGTQYIGNFENAHLHKGTILYPNGDQYEGSIKESYPHGFGTFTYRDGTEQKGNFENGKFKN